MYGSGNVQLEYSYNLSKSEVNLIILTVT